MQSNRVRHLVVSLIILLCVGASSTWGIIIPVGGNVSAFAQTSAPGFGTQTSSPAPVTIGTAPGSYINQAIANSGAAHADITTTWPQSATSVSLSITGDVHRFSSQNGAEASGGALATFSLDEPTLLRAVATRTGTHSGLNGFIRDANNIPVIGFSTINGGDSTQLFPAGTYTLVTQGGSLQSPTDPGETSTVTLTIVPEPSLLTLGVGAGVILTSVSGRRRRVS